MFTLLRAGWAMFAPYRFWALAIAAAGVLTTVLVFYGNCRANAVALDGAYQQIQELRIDLNSARAELQARNKRISDMNKQRLEELQQAEEILRDSLTAAKILREERDAAKLELEETRFELLETIRDDEDFADWVDWDVPVAAWGLLQSAVEGGTNSGMRTDD